MKLVHDSFAPWSPFPLTTSVAEAVRALLLYVMSLSFTQEPRFTLLIDPCACGKLCTAVTMIARSTKMLASLGAIVYH